MTDVTHSPATDWCACEPEGDERCGYRFLADAVIGKLNPVDGDEAEVALCIAAVERIAAYVESLPCTCVPALHSCRRCQALGRAR
jgi:hypothetical protein